MQVLEKSLNFFLTLNVVAWKVFFGAFWLSKTNINHGSKVTDIEGTIINYQFKTSELKNVEELVKQTVQALKPY